MLRSSSTLVVALMLLSACHGNGSDTDQIMSPSFIPGAGLDAGGGVLLGAADAAVPVFVPRPDAGPFTPGVGAVSTMDASTVVVRPLDDAGSAPDVFDAGPAPTTNGSGNPCGAGQEPLAAGVRLSEVSLYQTVKIPLYKAGAWVTTRNATVVQGKKTLIRAFVETMSGFAPRMLHAVLTLDNGGTTKVLTADRTISRTSTDDATDSTFDFQVDGALIDDATQLSVAVQEPTCPAQPAAAPNTAARVPATGTQALNATAIAKLHAVMVPVTLNGRTPDTSEAQLTKIRDALRAYYPVADVNVTARAPITWSGSISADGTGWSELLNQIGRQRQLDAPASDVYYFGLMTPTSAFRDYCRTGCVLGLAPQTTFVSRANQIGLGVGFVDENTYTTVVHELGHAHGLPHAPCVPRGGSIQGADTKYPYTGGKIGVWGWDSRVNKLMNPASFTDIMGYCDPVWISDYNYEKIATRSKAVNTEARIFYADQKQPATTWQGILLFASGGARWSGITLDEEPVGTTKARALDADGDFVAEVPVMRVPLSHSDDSYLYVPDLDSSWVSLDLGDRTLRIADIAPER